MWCEHIAHMPDFVVVPAASARVDRWTGATSQYIECCDMFALATKVGTMHNYIVICVQAPPPSNTLDRNKNQKWKTHKCSNKCFPCFQRRTFFCGRRRQLSARWIAIYGRWIKCANSKLVRAVAAEAAKCNAAAHCQHVWQTWVLCNQRARARVCVTSLRSGSREWWQGSERIWMIFANVMMWIKCLLHIRGNLMIFSIYYIPWVKFQPQRASAAISVRDASTYARAFPTCVQLT